MDVVIDDPDDVKLRRQLQANALPKFASAAELQAWLDDFDAATTVPQLRAVMKDKIKALAVSAVIERRT